MLVVLNQSAPYRAPMCSLWAGTVNFIYFRLSSWSSPPLTSQNYNQHKWISVWERTKDSQIWKPEGSHSMIVPAEESEWCGCFLLLFFLFNLNCLQRFWQTSPICPPREGVGWLSLPWPLLLLKWSETLSLIEVYPKPRGFWQKMWVIFLAHPPLTLILSPWLWREPLLLLSSSILITQAVGLPLAFSAPIQLPCCHQNNLPESEAPLSPLLPYSLPLMFFLCLQSPKYHFVLNLSFPFPSVCSRKLVILQMPSAPWVLSHWVLHFPLSRIPSLLYLPVEILPVLES